MTKPKIKYVQDQYASHNIPGHIDELILWLNNKVDAIGLPRDQISIDIDTRPDYDRDEAILEFSYQRLETKKEVEERLKEEDRQKLWELQQYESLKKKFEKSSS